MSKYYSGNFSGSSFKPRYVKPECYSDGVFFFDDSTSVGSHNKSGKSVKMRLARIDDRYMFPNSSNSNKSHVYCVYYDPKSKHSRVVKTTHLFVGDDKSFHKIAKNQIYKTYFRGFYSVSGVNHSYFDSFNDGSSITLSDPRIRYLPSDRFSVPGSQADFIYDNVTSRDDGKAIVHKKKS